MNRSHFWKALFVVFVAIWAATEVYPPKARNLIDQFDQGVTQAPDATLEGILARARELEAQLPGNTYSNLLSAIGTNDITRYFPTNYLSQAVGMNPTRVILNRVQRDAAGRFKLGIDLQGGTAFLLELDTSRVGSNTVMQAIGESGLVDQAVEVIRRRVDSLGVSEPVIQPAGDNRILVQLPGLSESDKESARLQIQKAAFLEFKMVDPDLAQHLATGLIPAGYERKVSIRKNKRTGEQYSEVLLVKRAAEMTGEQIERAGVSMNPMTGQPEILFSLKSDGARRFAEVTSRSVGQRLAIVLDGEVLSAPTINSPITGGSGQITGDFDLKEAYDLAAALENPLRTPLQIVEERGVDPSLGRDSVESGIKASLYGIIAVAAFMLVYYMFAGVVANIALVLNMLLLLGVMCSLDVTYTLPGIAGIVLTVGMAVDANVLIYERIREELRAGKSVRGAVAAGYDKAFSTILDSNLTTLITSILLIILGTGPIKGFGVALSIGIAVSMFTALVVTRLVFDTWLATGERKSLPMLHLIRGAKIDFLRFAKPAFVLSWILILAGCAYGLFGRGRDMLGIEFAGGDNLVLRFEQKVPVDEIRKSVDGLRIGESIIQYQRDLSSGKETLRVSTAADEVAAREGRPGNGAKVETALETAFPQAKFERVALDTVGPTVGFEIQKSAIIASLLALFGILVYVAFRYEFSFAVGAVLAVMHDVLMTVGVYCLTGLFSDGRQFNATFVAGLMTIIGFSINDTIVIFDRIREDLKLGKRGSFKEIINTALNETLSRTIITSGTTLIATVILYVFGGGPINDFAFTFLVGIITGTYSTIYIASALVLWWHKGERPKIGTPVNPSNVAVVDEAAEAARA